MRNGDRIYRHEIRRVCGTQGHHHPMPIHRVADQHLYLYGDMRGHDAWETAEQYLVDQFTSAGWGAGRYEVTVTVETDTGVHPVVTVERFLPLHRAYADLGYSRSDDGRPARAYVHTLVSRYPGTSIETIAEHLAVFDDHYRGRITTGQLVERTGYLPPEGWVRPVSPYVDGPHLND